MRLLTAALAAGLVLSPAAAMASTAPAPHKAAATAKASTKHGTSRQAMPAKAKR